MSTRKDMADLIDTVKTWPGWRVEDTADGWMIYPPDKSKGMVNAHKTPQDHRAVQNTKSRLRRAGGPI